jgi:hypothetical protein
MLQRRPVVSTSNSSIDLTSLFYVVLQGSGVHLLKTGSKRRRTKAEIANSEQLKVEEENMIRTKMARLE